SAERPPCKTAILIACTSRPAADPFHFCVQPDAEALSDPVLDAADQPVHIGGRSPPPADDEGGVPLPNPSRALASTPQAGSLAPPAGRIARRVLEHAAAVLAPDGLGARALCHPVRHLPPGSFPIPGPKVQPCTGHHRPVQRPGAKG